jgi:hypothetical protein
MSCGGFQPSTPVEYYCGDSFVPCRVLYAVGELYFCQFETRHWAGYQGYCVFTTTAVFLEHLRPAEERPMFYI